MKYLCRILAVSILALLAPPARSFSQTSAQLMVRATAAVQTATARAQADPAHPAFHITAPAQWINDPNGPIYHNGYYHLFYQLHPFSDGSGPKYWGHVRSRDLVKWEHLPIALCPSPELGEAEVWSGCCTVNGRGQPMIFYTSIAHDTSASTHAEQWAATSDDAMLLWHKLPANPVLSESLHGERKIYDWRDPFIFRASGKTFLVTGGNLNQARGGQAIVNIYQAQNDDLTQWTYRGVLFQHPDADARTVECPNFFRLGTQWVLLLSPYGRVQYFIGDFDPAECRFHPHHRGLVDYGPNFYAPNTMQLASGRRLVWGWVNGFPEGHGWNGCLSLPRQLSLSPDGQLQQEPAPELRKLRGAPRAWRRIPLNRQQQTLSLPDTDALEIQVALDLQNASSVLLQLKGEGQDTPALTLQCSPSELVFQDTKAALEPANNELRLHIFLDRSVFEVFANKTACVTKTIRPLTGHLTLTVSAENGTGRLKRVEAWPMKSIWPP
jgi:beta-fructofuranosidase